MTDRTSRAELARRVLAPRSIAIIGASTRNHITQSLLRNLAAFRFPGRLHLINPNYTDIDGQPCHPDVAAVGEPVDLAIILVPADAVAEAVAASVDAGVKAVMVMTAGFGEDQRGSGKERERALLRAVEGRDVVVAGPNAEGYLDTLNGVWLSFSPSVDKAFLAHATRWAGTEADIRDSVQGGTAIVTQSGGLGFAVFGRGVERGIGFSHVVSLGNEVDLDVLDCAEYMLTLPEVKVVAMYVEGFRRPERLRAVAAAARAAGKWLVIGKSGDSKSGGAAAVSHTGHLAGASATNHAAFRRFGIVSVNDQEEMLDVCSALAVCPPLKGNRIGVISSSGGAAVWTADACERLGLELPELAGPARDQLAELLPAFANIRNPIDMTGASKTTQLAVLEAIADDDLDGFVLILPLSLQRMVDRLRTLPEVIERIGKPVIVYSYTTPCLEAYQTFREMGVPIYESSSRAARALSALHAASGASGFAAEMAEPRADLPAQVLSEKDTTERLRREGFPTTRQGIARSEDEAAAIAAELGCPVAMKLQAPSIPHKDKIGGVALDVEGEERVRSTYRLLVERAAGFADLEGVLVQEMVPPGVEMIVGIDNTSGFGPMVLVGFGGSNAEALNDATLRCAPLTAGEVREMLGELRHGALLTEPIGGLPVLPVDAFVDLVVRLSEFAVANAATLRELDINPVVLSPNGIRIVDSMMVELGSEGKWDALTGKIMPQSR